jgi:hypothetical protein
MPRPLTPRAYTMRLPLEARLLVLPILLVLALSTGCTSMKREYPSHSPDTVWAVMKTVAEQPTYDDWIVLENHAWADEPGKRIEVYRLCRRDRHDPGTRSWREDRTWKFQVLLDEANPPRVKFVSRHFAIPAHARIEADRYFDEVGELLSGKLPDALPTMKAAKPAEAPVQTGPDDAPAETAPPAKPAPEKPIDVDAVSGG